MDTMGFHGDRSSVVVGVRLGKAPVVRFATQKSKVMQEHVIKRATATSRLVDVVEGLPDTTGTRWSSLKTLRTRRGPQAITEEESEDEDEENA